jgi:hypothetical protein
MTNPTVEGSFQGFNAALVYGNGSCDQARTMYQCTQAELIDLDNGGQELRHVVA